MLRQNKFISLISIIGTALAIMMIMVIIVVLQIKNADISPENKRSKTLYTQFETRRGKTDKWVNNSPTSYKTMKECYLKLTSPEIISAAIAYGPSFTVKTEEMKMRISANVKSSDPQIWDIMNYSFVDGSPFSQADFDSGVKTAVISESMSEKLFGKAKALGRTIEINNVPYKVVGVVKDVSTTFTYADADIWIPYTTVNEYQNQGYQILLTVKDDKAKEATSAEIDEYVRKENSINKEYEIDLWQLYTHSERQLNPWDFAKSKSGYRNRMIFIFLTLLIIPAINLSSVSLSRIKKRTEEIGIRKAFGAKKHVILMQVLYENFITSLLGGIIGLGLSYVAVILLKDWLLGVSGQSIPLGSMITPSVFAAVFIASFILNLLSSAIPAYKAAGMKIIDSLEQKNA